jgi:ribonuclease HII
MGAAVMQPQTRPTLKLEHRLQEVHPGEMIVGMDEVGCASFAGPVGAGAVSLPLERKSWFAEVNDSKLLSRETRERLSVLIRRDAACGVGAASPAEVDALGMMKARVLAMRRALSVCRRQLGPVQVAVLVDGADMRFAEFTPNGFYINKGDTLSISIAAASIIAKVARDTYMAGADLIWPGYGWAHNAGYGTPEHWQAILDIGITPEHRRRWGPIRKLLNEQELVSSV